MRMWELPPFPPKCKIPTKRVKQVGEGRLMSTESKVYKCEAGAYPVAES